MSNQKPYWQPRDGGTHGNKFIHLDQRKRETQRAVGDFEVYIKKLIKKQRDRKLKSGEPSSFGKKRKREGDADLSIESPAFRARQQSPSADGVKEGKSHEIKDVTGGGGGEGTVRRAMLDLKYDEKTRSEVDGMLGSNRASYHRRKFESEFDHTELLRQLPEEQQDIYRENPHLRQVFANRHKFHRSMTTFNDSDRLLTEEKGRTPYRSRNMEVKTVEHWGQRKLLLSEIEFLTMYTKPGDTMVYAGAAPGTHINFLAAALFPEISFVLVDPARFDTYETRHIQIRNKCFTDEMAEEYSGRGQRLLFICDIRSMDSSMSEEEKEERVLIDMDSQRRWVEMMQPRASMLKFRLPYNVKKHPKVTYLKGDIFLPVWGPRTTSECRLVVTSLQESVDYDVADYEQAMFHFNTVTRVSYFEHSQRAEGYDHRYDCTAETHILKKYLIDLHGLNDAKVLRRAIDELAEILSCSCGSSRKTLRLDPRGS